MDRRPEHDAYSRLGPPPARRIPRNGLYFPTAATGGAPRRLCVARSTSTSNLRSAPRHGGETRIRGTLRSSARSSGRLCGRLCVGIGTSSSGGHPNAASMRCVRRRASDGGAHRMISRARRHRHGIPGRGSGAEAQPASSSQRSTVQGSWSSHVVVEQSGMVVVEVEVDRDEMEVDRKSVV